MTDHALHLGPWQTALAGVQRVDAVIVDAPYSQRTHSGHDGQAPRVYDRRYHTSRGRPSKVAEKPRRAIGYAGWAARDVVELVEGLGPRCAGWFVTITDHVLAPTWADALEALGRYVFAPIPWVAPGSRVRMSGDGPSSWTCWIVVARPREGADRNGTPWHKWGTLPGAYVVHQTKGGPVVGGKPIGLMRALVRDYTRPGDLVCDPCAGWATTGRACQLEGRRFVGAEMDPATHALAVERLARPFTAAINLDAGPDPVQSSFLDDSC
jgi:site-specific DNA-methyltransferase (adenine-specific)